MTLATLCFLIERDEEGSVSNVCLAMKKRGFAKGKWNGMGGKVEAGETIEHAMVREVEEEIGVIVRDFKKVAELSFSFTETPEWDQIVHTYICEQWFGDPAESEEMKPQWYKTHEIPYEQMWEDDKFWLPEVLEGKRIKAEFAFKDDKTILDQVIEVLEEL